MRACLLRGSKCQSAHEGLFERGCVAILRISSYPELFCMYQALYRKYRSQTFDDLCGQEHISEILRRQCESGNTSHAYLFCGTRGTGKTSSAKILAKAVNCLSLRGGNPCNECEACRAINSEISTDVLEIDAASNNGVNNIRDLRDEVLYPPSVLKKRVYIIDEVHMLTDAAFNALLKTLEEPPEYVVFILCTTELHKIPPTILSRCQRYDFRRIAQDVIVGRLKYIAGNEGIELTSGAAERLAKLADGGMRDAISLLDSCAAGGLPVDEALVERQLGLSSCEVLLRMFESISRSDAAAALNVLDGVYRSSVSLSVFLEDMLIMTRDLLVAGSVSGAEPSFVMSDAESGRFRALCGSLRTESLLHAAEVLEDIYVKSGKYSENMKLIFEIALLELCSPALGTSVAALSDRVGRLERGIGTGTQTAAGHADPVEPIREEDFAQELEVSKAPEGDADLDGGDTTMDFSSSDDVKERIRRALGPKPALQSVFATCEVRVVSGRVTLGCAGFQQKLISSPENMTFLENAVREVLGKSARVEFTKPQPARAAIDEINTD